MGLSRRSLLAAGGATTSAIATTAASAGHHDVSIPQDGTGGRPTPPRRPTIHPNR